MRGQLTGCIDCRRNYVRDDSPYRFIMHDKAGAVQPRWDLIAEFCFSDADSATRSAGRLDAARTTANAADGAFRTMAIVCDQRMLAPQA